MPYLQRVILATMLAAVFPALTMDANAQTPLGTRFGAGFSLGEPTAFTMKFRVGRSSAVDFGIGRSVLGYPRVHGDYIWQFLNVFDGPYTNLYAGVGGLIGLGEKGRFFLFNSEADADRWYNTDKTILAGRGVIGIDHFLRFTPIELYGELSPIIGFLPKTGLAMEFAIGARFYFR